MYVCMYINGQYSKMRVTNSLRIARKRAVNIHPESRSKSGQISIFLLRHTIELRLEARLCHVVLRAPLCSVSISNSFAHDPLLKKLGHF